MQLIWIENDDERFVEKNERTSKQIKRFLHNNWGETNGEIDLKPTYGFWRLEREDQYKILFDTQLPIVTWSVYTYNGVYNSARQLEVFLGGAGRNNIKGKTLIDASGMILEALNRIIRDAKFPLDIIKAISNNTILTNSANLLVRVYFETKSCTFKFKNLN